MEGVSNAPGSWLNKPGASVSEWTYGAMAAFFMAIALGSYIPLGLTTWTTVTSTVVSGVVSAWALCGGTFRLAHSIRHLSVAKIFLVVGVASTLQAAEALGDQNHVDWLMLTAVVDSSRCIIVLLMLSIVKCAFCGRWLSLGDGYLLFVDAG